MSYDCEHCLNYTENSIGEKVAYCEVWDCWRNISRGFCFGNCDMQYREGEKMVNKPMTNGDRIRAMTDEELAKAAANHIPLYSWPDAVIDIYLSRYVSEYGAWLEWVKTAKEDAE